MTRAETRVLGLLVGLAAAVLAWDGCRPRPAPRGIGAVYSAPEQFRRGVVEREVMVVNAALRAGMLGPSVRQTCHADGCLWCDGWGCSWEAAPQVGECDDAGVCPGGEE